jgi:hypothetical protein
VAARFELYLNGVELANGFHELADADVQRARFERQLHARAASGQPAVPMDERLLAALEHGLPDCAGVALGFDRLVMLALARARSRRCLPFRWIAPDGGGLFHAQPECHWTIVGQRHLHVGTERAGFHGRILRPRAVNEIFKQALAFLR